MKDNLAMLEYLRIIDCNGPWDLWLTLTSREEIYYDKVVYCFVCFETDSRFGVHVHAFIRGIHPKYHLKVESKCYAKFGRSQVEPYFARGGAEYYMALKCSSGSSEDSGFMKINSRMRQRPPV